MEGSKEVRSIEIHLNTCQLDYTFVGFVTKKSLTDSLLGV
jgi:hypothetical protein